MNDDTRRVLTSSENGAYACIPQCLKILTQPNPCPNCDPSIDHECEDCFIRRVLCENRRTVDRICAENMALQQQLDDRDKQWIEAIAPGNSDTDMGKLFGTPEKYAVLRQEELKLAEEDRVERDARCDGCGATLTKITCARCGAPVCCPQCCRIDALAAEVERLQAIVGKLPKTADGVPFTPDLIVFACDDDGVLHESFHVSYCADGKREIQIDLCNETEMSTIEGLRPGDCFSTREAAQAARGE